MDDTYHTYFACPLWISGDTSFARLALMGNDDLCVTRVPIFQGLTAKQQEHVAGFARPIHIRKGQPLYTPGAPLSRLLVVHSGKLKVSRESATGQEQILRVAAEGDVLGEREFLTGAPSSDVVIALEDSRICTFDHADLEGLLQDFPDIAQRMLRSLSDRLASIEHLLATVTSSDVRARVAAYILGLAGSEACDGDTVQLPIAKHEVAAYLGTTPETVSRRLAALASEGVIELLGRRRIQVLDIGKLSSASIPSSI